MPAPGLVKLGFLRLRFSNNFAVGFCGVGCPKIVFALGARPKTKPQAIQMQKKCQEAFKIKKSDENGAKSVAKRSQRSKKVSTWSQKTAKSNQKKPKWSEKLLKLSHKGAKRRPKCIQKSPWAPRSILGTGKGVRGVNFWILFGAFLVQKDLKNQCKIRCRKKHEISWNFFLKREPKSMPKLIKNQWSK